MKIVGVSLGTRNGMNDSVCKEALHEAQLMGAEVEFIHLLDWDIKYCTGCVACSRSMVSGKGNVCTLKDDFEEFRSHLLDADGILVVGPIFEKGTTGLFHTLMDRMGPRLDKGFNIMADQMAKAGKGKAIDPRILQDRVISFIGIGGSDWCTNVEYDQAMLVIGSMWKIIDNEKFAWSKTIVMDDDKMARVKEIAHNLAEAASDIEHAQYKGEDGVCPHCHSKNFHIDSHSKHVTCCYCGIQGTFEIDDQEIRFVFPEEQLEHAHDTLPGKAIHAADVRQNEGESTECKKSQKWKDSQIRLKSYDIPEVFPTKNN